MNINTIKCYVLRLNRNNSVTQEKILYIYRYISWALTSIVYFSIMPNDVLVYKLGVILSLLMVTSYLNKCYFKYIDNVVVTRSLIFAEIIGIEFLLLPTGGLESPFIWYALNPILIASSYLPSYLSWVSLIYYLLTCPLMSLIFFNPQKMSLLQIYINNINLLLVFILINLAMQLLSKLANELQKSNNEKEDVIEQIMKLYQIIETLNNNNSQETLLEHISLYTSHITKGGTNLFWLKENDILIINESVSNDDFNLIKSNINRIDLDYIKNNKVSKVLLNNKYYITCPIMSPTFFYGIGAIEVKEKINLNIFNSNTKHLKFITELISVMLDRFYLENIENQLHIMEEQNRIANEMHDNVSQRLFSITYGLHGLLGNLDSIPKKVERDFLIEMKNSSNEAMQELRKIIYKLSTKKNGNTYLKNTVTDFVNNIAKLHNISVDFSINGNEGDISSDFKKTIIRIIRESCANSIKHGNCNSILIRLSLEDNYVNLMLYDNGKGFLYSNVLNCSGLGLSNIKSQVNSYNGDLKIESNIGKGTKINISIPIVRCLKEKENVAI